MRTWLSRLGTLLLFLLVGLCFAPSLIPPFLDRIYYEGGRSDHYDGERFFNLGASPGRDSHGGPARFLNRIIGSDERARWPERVPVTPAVPPRRVAGAEMRVTWVGHATVLVQTAGLNILTDPIWSERASPFSFVGPKRVRAPGIRFEDLPKIDLVLVSHNHYDHMDLATLKRLWDRDRPQIVTSLGNDTILRDRGIESKALDWSRHLWRIGDSKWRQGPLPMCGFDGCVPYWEIRVSRNHHWSSRWGTDRNRALWSAFTVTTPAGKIFFAGDTGYGDGSWADEAALQGPIRLAILPIGAYEPRDIMKSNHVDPDEAVRLFEKLGARTALGMHWGTFQLTFESIDDPPRRLAKALQARGIPRERFVATEAGRTVRVP